MSAAREVVVEAVGQRREELLDLSHRIHADPEVGWSEHRAAARVVEFMADRGFLVKERYLGLETAVRASFGSGPLHVVLCAEYDALPGLGHACGHNIIASSSVGAALALAQVADELGLTVTLLGTPAEEGGGGKILLLERGAFEGVHLALMAHPGPVDVARARPYAVCHLDIAFQGRAAHAAAYPEQGLNAADAFTVAQVAIGLLRQQLPGGTRVHGVITRGGEVANAIPERTEGRWYIRGDSMELMLETRAKVIRCFEAGALATGCTLEVKQATAAYAEFRTDEAMLAAYIRNAEGLGRVFVGEESELALMNRASTDMGNVSQVVPAIHPYIGIDSAPAVNHQREFAAACVTAVADQAVLDAATALALTVVDMASDEAERKRLLG